MGTGNKTIHTPETLRKLSAANKGKIITPEQRAAISATLKAKPKGVWITKDGNNRRVLLSELQTYLGDGWSRGRIVKFRALDPHQYN